jgi:hypothetical protein
MVGFLKETMDVQSFYDKLLLKGQHEVKELEEVMKFNKQLWDHCFSKIIP